MLEYPKEECSFHEKLDNNSLKHSPLFRILGVNLSSRVFVRIFQQDESVREIILLRPSRAIFLDALLFVLFSVFFKWQPLSTAAAGGSVSSCLALQCYTLLLKSPDIDQSMDEPLTLLFREQNNVCSHQCGKVERVQRT